MIEIIVMFIMCIPVYAVLLWTYFDPRESLLWGRRWMYKEEPEPSEGAIRYAKVTSAISIGVLTLIFIIFIFK